MRDVSRRELIGSRGEGERPEGVFPEDRFTYMDCLHCGEELKSHPKQATFGVVTMVGVKGGGQVGHDSCPCCGEVLAAWWEHPPIWLKAEAYGFDVEGEK